MSTHEEIEVHPILEMIIMMLIALAITTVFMFIVVLLIVSTTQLLIQGSPWGMPLFFIMSFGVVGFEVWFTRKRN